MTFRDFKIGTRLGTGFAAILVLMACMLATALWQFAQIAQAKDNMAAMSQHARLAHDWLYGIASNSVRNLAKIRSADAADEAYYDAQMKPVRDRISTLQKQLAAVVTGDDGKRTLQAVDEQRKRYAAVRDEALALKAKHGAGSAELKAFIAVSLDPAMDAYIRAVESVVAAQEQRFEAENARIDVLYANGRALLTALGLLAIACAALFGWLLTRSITHPLANAVALARRVAAGDLTADIAATSRDEVGDLLDALRDMNGNLRRTVTAVRAGTETIVTASEQIASGNMDLSARTEQQAASLEETASSMEELTSTIRQGADNAREASDLARATSDVATRGGAVVSQVVETMASISASSRNIGDIIGVIDSIAFQTNLLALNASVEAARAGEQGRGFAVVAAEVRNLAQRSANAAKEIRTLIAASLTQVDAGGKLVDEAGATMQQIVAGIARVSDLMTAIAAAGAEQAAGIEQVNVATIQMDTTTQQNAALVEEAAAAAASLKEQAAQLAQLVSIFEIGAGVPARHVPAPVGARARLALE